MAESIINSSPYKIDTIEMHTGGDPVRIIVSGFPKLCGNTINAKWRQAEDHYDHLRRALVLEPRGSHMYTTLLVERDNQEADLAALFMHANGYGSMCGHVTIALARYAIEYGLVESVAPETQVNIQWPCGLVKTFVEYDDQTKRSGRTRFVTVPAFAVKTDVAVDVPGYGTVKVDIAYGGEFYAYVSAEQLGLDVCKSPAADIHSAAVAVTKAVGSAVTLTHPTNPEQSTLYGTLITDGKDKWSTEPSANIYVSAGGQLARSACGSGITGRIALQIHKGLIEVNQVRRFQSGVNYSEFTAKAVERTKVGNYDAVVVEVAGKGHFIGSATFISEEDDALGNGFKTQ